MIEEEKRTRAQANLSHKEVVSENSSLARQGMLDKTPGQKKAAFIAALHGCSRNNSDKQNHLLLAVTPGATWTQPPFTTDSQSPDMSQTLAMAPIVSPLSYEYRKYLEQLSLVTT